MTLTRQNWKPDTCACVVEEEYDRDNPDAAFTCSAVISKCPAHSAVSDANLYGVLYANSDGENKRKNKVHGFMLNNLSTLTEIKTSENGSSYIEFKNGINVSWNWTGTGASRVLQVTVTGATLSNNQKAALTTFAESTFGAGKVVIV